MAASRRALLAALVTGPLGLAFAGCGEAEPPEDTETPAGRSDSPRGTQAPPTDESPTAVEGLDLREANVVAVSVARRDDGVRFEVTLHHDDAGEPGYANRWQVERLDGTRLGRRDLVHAHEQQPFTRSETVGIPAGMSCVVVRGHDETHGYGGRAMVVNVETGRTRGIDQGPEPRSVGPSACPS